MTLSVLTVISKWVEGQRKEPNICNYAPFSFRKFGGLGADFGSLLGLFSSWPPRQGSKIWPMFVLVSWFKPQNWPSSCHFSWFSSSIVIYFSSHFQSDWACPVELRIILTSLLIECSTASRLRTHQRPSSGSSYVWPPSGITIHFYSRYSSRFSGSS